MGVKHVSKALLFAHYTSVIVTDKDHDSFKQKTNLELMVLYCINQLALSSRKTGLINLHLKLQHVFLWIFVISITW